MLILIIFNQKEHLVEPCYALYRIILEYAQKQNDTFYNGVCFTGLCSLISFTPCFVSDLFHHLRLANGVSQQ